MACLWRIGGGDGGDLEATVAKAQDDARREEEDEGQDQKKGRASKGRGETRQGSDKMCVGALERRLVEG